MPGLTDARVEELNDMLTRLLPKLRVHIERIESATDLAQGHASAATVALLASEIAFGFTQARMPAFGRISI